MEFQKEGIIRIIPIIADVSGMTYDEILFKFGDVYGFKNNGEKIIAEVGFIQVGGL